LSPSKAPTYIETDPTKAYKVPNTVLNVWMGDMGAMGRWWVNYNDSTDEERNRKYKVIDMRRKDGPVDPPNTPWWNQTFQSDVLREVRRLSGSGALQGWNSWSHGNVQGIGNTDGDRDAFLAFHDIAASSNYGLAVAIVWACEAQAGQSAFIKGNPNGRYVSGQGIQIPYPWSDSWGDVDINTPDPTPRPPSPPGRGGQKCPKTGFR